LTNLDLDFAVKEISLGDTKTAFAVGDASQTSEQRLNTFISTLLSYGKAEFSKFRRLSW